MRTILLFVFLLFGITALAQTNPVFTASTTAESYAENGTGDVFDFNANDGDGGANEVGITYSLLGTDAGDFSISATGILTFVASPDFENPVDAGTNNVYNVTVRATDGDGNTDVAVVITVTNVAETPIFTASTTAESYAENGTGDVFDFNANDGDGGANEVGITYSLLGTDAGDFSISATGILTFVASPDFENPVDAGTNNVYNVTVRATDGDGNTDVAVVITVTDVAESNPTITTGAVTNRLFDRATVGYNVGAVGSPTAQKNGVIYYIADGNDYTLADVGSNTTGTPSGNPILESSTADNTTGNKTRIPTGLTAATEYSARPFASRNNDSNAGYGARVDFWTLDTQPNVVSTLTVASVTNTQVNLSWVAPTGGADRYYLLGITNSGPNQTALDNDFANDVADGVAAAAQTNINSPFTDAVSTTSTTISSLAAETRYYVGIVPFNIGGNVATSNYNTSNPATNTFWTLSDPPTVHSTLAASAVSSTSVKLDFVGAGTLGVEADGYLLLRKTSPFIEPVDYAFISNGVAPPANGTVSGGTTVVQNITSGITFTNTGLTTGTTYHYALIPYKYNGTDDETYNYLNDDASVPNASATPNAANITAPSLTVCEGAETFGNLGDIVIAENGNGDFVSSGGSDVTLKLNMPANYKLQAGVGSVTISGADISSTPPNIFVNEDNLIVVYSVSGATNNNDEIRITGLKVRAEAGATDGSNIRFDVSSSGVISGVTGATNFATLNVDGPVNLQTLQSNYPGCGRALFQLSTNVAVTGGNALWSLQSGAGTFTPSSASTTPTANYTPNGAESSATFRLTSTAGGCTTVFKEITVNFNDLPTTPGTITPSMASPCSGTTGVQYQITGAIATNSYVWEISPSTGWMAQSSLTTTGATTSSIIIDWAENTTSDVAYTISAKAVTPQGCEDATPTELTSHTVKRIPNVIANPLGSSSYPSDNTTALPLSGTSGGTPTLGTWSGAGVIFDAFNNRYAFRPSLAGNPKSPATTLYNLTYTVTANGCPVSKIIPVTITDPSASGILGLGNGKFAIYDSDVNLTLNVPAPPDKDDFLFDDPGTCDVPKVFSSPTLSTGSGLAFQITQNTPTGNCNPTTPNIARATFRPTQTGVTTENTSVGHTLQFGTAPEGITVYARPASPIVSATSISLCEGEDISSQNLTITGNNGATSSQPIKYRWYQTANPNPGNNIFATPSLTNLIPALDGPDNDGTTATTASYTNLGVSTATGGTTRTVWLTQVIEDDGTFAGVESLPVEITFTVKNQPKTTNLTLTSGSTTYCDNENLEILEVTSTFPTGSSFNWEWSTDNFTTTISAAQIASTATSSRFIGQPVLTTGAPPTYYVRQIVEGCVGETFTINITVNPIPATPTLSVPGGPADICEGTAPATFTINGAGASSVWEVSETSATTDFDGDGTLTSGVTFETNGASTILNHGAVTLSATKKYWVRQIINGCPSVPLEVTFPVNANPPQPSDITTATKLVYCEDATDLELRAQGSNLAGYIWQWSLDNTTYFDSTNEPAGYAITNAGNVSTLTSTTALGTTPADQNFWVRQVNTNGSLNCNGAEREINIVVNPEPNQPTITTAPTETCDFDTPSVPIIEQNSATPSVIRWEWTSDDPSGTPTWYATNTTNTIFGAGTLGAVNILVANSIETGPSRARTRLIHQSPLTTTTSYWVREVINGCPGPPREVIFTINPKPAAPTFTAPAGICQGATPANLVINGVGTGTSRVWEMKAQADFSGTAYPKVTAASGATNGVELVTGGANPANVTIVHNDALTTPQPSYVYYVRQIVDGCASDPVQVTFNVTATPAAPTENTIFTVKEYCEGATTLAVAADGAIANTFEWSNDNSSFIPATVGTIILTGTATGSQLVDSAPLNTPGTLSRWVRQVTPTPATPGCVSPTTQIDFEVYPTPVAPTLPVAIPAACASEIPANVVVNGTAGTTVFQWSSVSATDFTQPLPVGVSFDNSTAGESTLIHTVTLTGNTSYWVRQVINGCPGNVLEVQFVATSVPGAPALTSGQDLEFCSEEDVAGISVTGTATSTIEWSDKADFSNILISNKTGTTSTYVPGVVTTNSPTKFYVRQSEGGICASLILEVDIIVNQLPSQPSIVNEPRQYCAGETLENIAAAGSDGAEWQWSDKEDFSSIISTAATLSNPIVLTNETEATRTITYYVRQENNGCTSEVQTVDINIAPVPVAPTVTNPEPFCTGTPISALTVEGEGIKWYRSAALGDANLVGSGNSFTPSSDVVDNTVAGTSSIFVTQTINSCESTASEIRVTYNALPNAPVVTAQVVYCSGETIAPITAVGTNLTWYSDEELTTVAGTGESFQPEISNEVNVTTTNTFYVTQTSNNCRSGAARVSIIVNPRPVVSISGLAATYCADSAPAELLGSPAQTDGTRGTFSGPGVLLAGGISVFNPSIAGIGTHTITYEFENANGCTASTTREVVVKPFPEVDFTGFNSVLEYCIDDNEVELVGSPLGGSFSGRGVVGGTATFRPADAEVGAHPITYTYTDEGGCTNTKTITVNVVASPIVSFIGFNAERAYCIDATPVNLVGQLSGNPVDLGTFTGAGVTGKVFNPAEAGVGRHTVRFEFANESGCSSFQEQEIVVNPLPIVSLTISGIEEGQEIREFCQDAGSVGLSPSPAGGTFSSNGGVVAFQGNNLLTNATPTGEHEIIYTYQDPITKCSQTVSRKIIINPIPVPQIAAVVSCNDIKVDFNDVSTIAGGGEIVSRVWNFGDGSTPSSEIAPTHQYQSRGNYTVTLTVTTNTGCVASTTQPIFIGDLPESSFNFANVCLGQDVAFDLNFTIINPDQLGKIKWDFGDGTSQEFDESQTATHRYAEIGTYTARLTVETAQFCSNTITREISIFPSFLGENAVFPYQETFEEGTGGWIAKGDSSTWALGEPSGEDIKPNTGSPTVWVTNLSGFYKNNEQSFVEGPCLDIRSLERPMISMDIAIDSDFGRDGAVLQFTADDGKTWANVGALNDPINWYNSNNVIGTPGNQNFGEGSFAWSGRVEQGEVENNWITARHFLDNIKNNEIIRLRVAFGADASFNQADGFAFDNVWIGERAKIALLESFTNVSQATDANVMPIINDLVQQNAKDAVAINYHIAAAGTDPFNSVNDLDPSGRALYYSISQAPNFAVDGSKFETNGINFLNAVSMSQFTKTVVDSLQARALQDVQFGIDVQIPDAALGLNTVTVQVTSNITTNNEIVVHLAAVEREITTVTTTNGQTKFEWVLRALNPSGGTSFQGIVWTPGTAQEREIEWQVPAFESQLQIALIAFVQNNVTGEVYQSIYKKPAALPTVVLGTNNLLPEALQTIELYPNPSASKVYLLFNGELTEEHQWVLYNNNGRRLQMGTVNRGSNGFELDVSKYPTGLYHIQLGKEGGYLIYKKVIVNQN